LQHKLDTSRRNFDELNQKYLSLESSKNDLQNALALNSASIIRIRRLETKEELLNKNLEFFKSNVTILLETLSNLKEYHLETKDKLKNSYEKRVDLIKELNAINLDTFKSQFNSFFSELVSIDNLKDFGKYNSKLKNDVIFQDIAKKIIPMPEESADAKTDQIGTQKKKKAPSSQQVENKKLKERLAYVAADNYVKKNEINNLKLDF